MTEPLVTSEFVALPDHRVDLARHALLDAAGKRVDLRPQAIDLLCLLARHAGETVDRRHLMDRLWPGSIVTDDSLVQAISDIRRAIGDESHQVVQTVPRRGYRLIASPPPRAPPDAVAPLPAGDADPLSSSIGAAASAAVPVTLPADAQPAAPLHRRAPRPLLMAVLAVLALMGAMAAWRPWQQRTDGAPSVASPDRPPIAVLDFSDPAAPAEDRLIARAYAEELSGELSRNADLAVIAAASSLAVASRGRPAQPTARQLGVGYLVSGTLRREGEHLRLLVQLVDGRDGRVVWTERHDVAAAQVYTVRDAIVQRVAGSLHSTLRGNQDDLSRQRPPASMDLYAMTMRATSLKHRITPQDSAEARALLERVVALDPGYAPGWQTLGTVNGIDWAFGLNGPPFRPGLLPLAIGQLEKAIALDPHQPAAFASLAVLLQGVGRHADAVRAGQRCMALAPSNADCLLFLAGALVWDGQAEPALPLARRAMAISPLPPAYVQQFYGNTLWANGLLAEALAAFDACLEGAPRHLGCRFQRIIARAEAGQLDAARADLAEWQREAGPEIAPEAAADTGYFSAAARALVERQLTALKRLRAPAVAVTRP